MKKGYHYIILTALLYSTHEIAGKTLADKTSLDPMQIVFLIYLVAAAVLLPTALKELKTREIKLNLSDLGYFMLTGTLCIPISLTLIQMALYYTQASIVALILSVNIIFTVPFAYLLLKEKITKQLVIAITCGIVGLLFILNPFSQSGAYNMNSLFGAFLAILGTLAFSLYTVITARRIRYYGGSIINCFTFICGIAIMLILLLVLDKPVFSNITPFGLIILVYIGLFIKAVGYLFYVKAIEETSAIIASTVFLIKPGLAPLLALLILGEALKLTTVVGIIFIMGGIYISFISKKGGNLSQKG